VPALDVLPPDTGSDEAEPEPVPVDAEKVLARVRGTSVALPPKLQRLPDQPGWPGVIKDVHDSFDRVIADRPFVNQLPELDRDEASLRDDLVIELYREVAYPFEKATVGRYLQL
jgi:hypothetical protein